MLSRRQWLGHAALVVMTAHAGCGTILHPERKGQPAGPLDWSVVALDAVGLLFFFVPGVIAFAVDFNNGTIYLPPEQHYGGRVPVDRTLTSRPVRGNPRNVRDIERTVSEHARRAITLQPGGYQMREMASLDDFWTTHAEVMAT